MTTTITSQKRQIHYSDATLRRAERALRCTPFKLELFIAMSQRSVPLQLIAGKSGYAQQYTQRPLSELGVESNLMWLIQVGLLRREVDGQGITDSFRLTPLGRQIVVKWGDSSEGLLSPSFWERLLNLLNRWFKLPV